VKAKTLHPKHVVLLAICNYLTDLEVKEVYQILGSKKRWEGKSLLLLLNKYLDFECLRIKPFIPQDIWVYNYLFFECNKTINPFNKGFQLHKMSFSFKRTKLISQYEKEIITPQIDALLEARRIVRNLH
jgi:hypothetical protein